MGLTRSLLLGARIGRELWLRRRPFLLYLKPTPRCDCRCLTCNRWQESQGARKDELSQEQIRRILVTFRRAGCAVLTLWGGEPTLRRDLPEILHAAQSIGLRTSICTNGNSLPRRAPQILPKLDVLLCSLDGHGALHDEMRGVRGLFDRVVQGIELAARVNPRCDIRIWASVHRRNLHQLEQLASLARELGVGIEFFPLSPIVGHNDPLLLTAEERIAAFGEVQRLKRNSWPVRNPERALGIMAGSTPFQCNFGQISIHVDHTGRVYSCEDAQGQPLHVWGRVPDLDPDAVYRSETFRQVGQRLRHCNHCSLPCAVELSGNLSQALASIFVRSLD